MKIREIQSAVCERFGVRLDEMLSDRRRQEIARPRQIAYWLCRELTVYSFPKIGREFGRRDHTTIMAGCRVVDKRLRDDKALRAVVLDLMDILRARADSRPAINIYPQPLYISTSHVWGGL